MSSQLEVLVDSDAFVGRFYPDDLHHRQATIIFKKLEKQKCRILTTSFVVNETATVLSHKSGQAGARKFLTTLKKIKFPIVHINEELQKETLSFFQKQDRKGTSVVDCSNIVVLRRFGVASIFSFDKFYKKQAGISTVTENHNR